MKHTYSYKSHKGSCSKYMSVVCHCLVVDSMVFWRCCGWYCGECKGHILNYKDANTLPC